MFIQKMKYHLFSLVLVLITLVSHGQIKDSLLQQYQGEAHLFGAFNNRTSIVNGQSAKLLGIQGGLIFENKHKLLLAYSWMANPVVEQKIKNAHTSLADTTNQSISMNFFSIGQEYVWYQTEKWKFSVPTYLGIGTSNRLVYNTNNDLVETNNKVVVPFEIGVKATYYITDWLTANGGLGSRFAFSKASDSQLSGPYYNLGIGVLFGVIYKKIVD
jgi:hypothetical protein